MGWKNWPAWLKGGVIFIVLFMIFLSITLIADSQIPEESDSLRSSSLPVIPGIWINYFTFRIGDSYPRPSIGYMLFPGLYSAISYFLIGALIGWLVGKFRKK